MPRRNATRGTHLFDVPGKLWALIRGLPRRARVHPTVIGGVCRTVRPSRAALSVGPKWFHPQDLCVPSCKGEWQEDDESVINDQCNCTTIRFLPAFVPLCLSFYSADFIVVFFSFYFSCLSFFILFYFHSFFLFCFRLRVLLFFSAFCCSPVFLVLSI